MLGVVEVHFKKMTLPFLKCWKFFWTCWIGAERNWGYRDFLWIYTKLKVYGLLFCIRSFLYASFIFQVSRLQWAFLEIQLKFVDFSIRNDVWRTCHTEWRVCLPRIAFRLWHLERLGSIVESNKNHFIIVCFFVKTSLQGSSQHIHESGHSFIRIVFLFVTY